MIQQSIGLEDLCRVLGTRTQRVRGAASGASELGFGEETSIPIDISLFAIPGEVDASLAVNDTASSSRLEVFREGGQRFLRYRIATIGLGHRTEEVHSRIGSALRSVCESVRESPALWARYQAMLFGGFATPIAAEGDAELLADHLSVYQPNIVVLVEEANPRAPLAERSASDLALMTRYLNAGTWVGAQRPYALLFVLDREIPAQTFASYGQMCQRSNTWAASAQFTSESASSALVDHIRQTLHTYGRQQLSVVENGQTKPLE